MTLKNITRRIATSGAVAAISAIGFAGAAQAVTTSGCTATPLTPTSRATGRPAAMTVTARRVG